MQVFGWAAHQDIMRTFMLSRYQYLVTLCDHNKLSQLRVRSYILGAVLDNLKRGYDGKHEKESSKSA